MGGAGARAPFRSRAAAGSEIASAAAVNCSTPPSYPRLPAHAYSTYSQRHTPQLPNSEIEILKSFNLEKGSYRIGTPLLRKKENRCDRFLLKLHRLEQQKNDTLTILESLPLHDRYSTQIENNNMIKICNILVALRR